MHIISFNIALKMDNKDDKWLMAGGGEIAGGGGVRLAGVAKSYRGGTFNTSTLYNLSK